MDFAIQGSRPIWQQLTEQLARRIITGAYPLGSRFPAVRELAAEAGVNPNTMQRAITQLETLGLVTTNRTLGRTVTENAGALEEMRRRLAVECADGTRYYSDSQQVERFIAGENPDGTVRYGYGTEEQYGHDFKKG